MKTRFLALHICVCAQVALAGTYTHTHVYTLGEDIPVWAEKVGPYHNPHETYHYDTVPTCELRDVKIVRRESDLGEALMGHSYIRTPRLAQRFGVSQDRVPVCEMQLTSDETEKLINMISDDYWCAFQIDDLPAWGFIGRLRPTNADPQNSSFVPEIYTHRHFKFQMNGDQIVGVDLDVTDAALVYPGATLQFTTSTTWEASDTPFKRRFDRYLEASFFEQKIHWFSLINSVIMCLVLCGMVAIIIMKTLKNDFARLAASEVDELETLDRADESGWKLLHGDVFRKPKWLTFFSVFVSNGCHVGFVGIIVLFLSAARSYYTHSGTAMNAGVFGYALTQPLCGFVGAKTFRMYGGKGWRPAMVAQLVFLPSVAVILFVLCNVVAYQYGSTMAIPAKTTFRMVMSFVFICVPLHILGTILGRRRGGLKSFPCRVHQLRRPIPPKSFIHLFMLIFLPGLIAFGCVFIEMYFLFSSFWGYKYYYVYGFVFVIVVLFSCVLVCVSITCIYTLLNGEDYRWAWISFCSCASTSIYVFVYAMFYYFTNTRMSGALQFTIYIGATLFFCVCLALFSGFLGYFGASKFVWLVYRNIKSD